MGRKIRLVQVGGWDELVRLRADKQSLVFVLVFVFVFVSVNTIQVGGTSW